MLATILSLIDASQCLAADEHDFLRWATTVCDGALFDLGIEIVGDGNGYPCGRDILWLGSGLVSLGHINPQFCMRH